MIRTLSEGDVLQFTGPAFVRLTRILKDGTVQVKIAALDDVQVAREDESPKNDIETTQ